MPTAEAKTFADQSVAALAAVVKTGWALPCELKEPDFDALRGRNGSAPQRPHRAGAAPIWRWVWPSAQTAALFGSAFMW